MAPGSEQDSEPQSRGAGSRRSLRPSPREAQVGAALPLPASVFPSLSFSSLLPCFLLVVALLLSSCDSWMVCGHLVI